jgi:3-methyladenine DNA glycosylase/8-oxoguanine DNA glycosylase
MFQRTIPGFEPSPESFAISESGLRNLVDSFESAGLAVPGATDMFTALFTGIADQQISNDPGGNRWTRLIDDAVDMFLSYVETKTKTKKGVLR